jgi:hypothetical protein
MQTQKYSVNQHPIETILSWVKSGEIAIPEIQRPFVWDATKVRDLMDSLYQGFPIGYLISWKNPNVQLKDGSLSEGKKILIDGQQRVTALRAAVLDEYVVDKNYKQVKITIAFNPVQGRFEVSNPAIRKDKEWIPAIAKVFDGSIDQFDLLTDYLQRNPEADKAVVKNAISGLIKMPLRQIGLIELASELDIEVVTEIFIRINSQGVVLSQADFAMSKIAANELYGGQNLRKAIDYFCHLAIAPEYYPTIRDNDTDFTKTAYFPKMSWLKNENDDLYDPTYTDMLRVTFGTMFKRGKLADLVSLLSGRNFETRTFEEEIAENSFALLKSGVMKFMNETEFKRFVMIIKSAGFIQPWMIRSKNAINFAYLLYLTLRDNKVAPAQIESFVRRWFVLTILTGRSTGSFESQFDYDIKQLANRDFGEYLQEIETAELGEAFWNAALPMALNTSSSNSPFWHVFLAAQVKKGDKGFLSRDIRVEDMIEHRGDIHHIFPKDYLKRNGLTRGKYNQIANYVYMQSEINVKVGNKAPNDYMGKVREQIDNGSLQYSGISDLSALNDNLRENGVPLNIFDLGIDHYEAFLQERRKLMAEKIQGYYWSL